MVWDTGSQGFLIYVPWREVIFSLILSNLGVLPGGRQLGYLLLGERTWCLIQPVGERGSPCCLWLLALLPKDDWKLWMVS